jgi:hypothetical protein
VNGVRCHWGVHGRPSFELPRIFWHVKLASSEKSGAKSGVSDDAWLGMVPTARVVSLSSFGDVFQIKLCSIYLGVPIIFYR